MMETEAGQDCSFRHQNRDAFSAWEEASSPLPKKAGKGLGIVTAFWVAGRASIRLNQTCRLSRPSTETLAQGCDRTQGEEVGLVSREVVSDRPIAVTYEITDFGKTALGFLEVLKDWVENHQI